MLKLTFRSKSRKKRAQRSALGGAHLAIGLGEGVGELADERVFERGQPVQDAPSYAGGYALVSPRYPVVAAEGRQTDSGAVFYPAGSLHRNVKRGTYSVSGGLRRGRKVVRRGRDGASILFRGRSEGQQVVWGPMRADGTRVAKGRKVSNALKAATVLQAHGVNVLEWTDAERRAAAAAIADRLVDDVERMMPRKSTWTRPRLSGMARRIRRRLR